MQRNKDSLWDDSSIRKEFEEKIMDCVNEVLDNKKQLSPEEFLEFNIKKNKLLTDLKKDELIKLKAMLQRLKKHEAYEMAKPDHLVEEIGQV